MNSIAELDTLGPSEPLDLDMYPETRGFTLPSAGEYTVRAPESFPDEAFGRSQASGAVTAQVDPTIVGPTSEGTVIRYTRVSAKKFARRGMPASQLGDYLVACGLRGRVTDDEDNIRARVRETTNLTYLVEADWKAFHKPTGFTIKGMRNFPSDGNGGYQSYVEHPTEKDPITKEPLRVRANLVVTRFVPAHN